MNPHLQSMNSLVARSEVTGVCYFLTWEGIMAIAAVGALGMTAYGIATAPGAPAVSSPPPPSNYVQYGEDGGVVSRQVYDEASNTWTTYGANSEPQKPANEWAANITGDYNKDMQNASVSAEVERQYNKHVQGDPYGVSKHGGGWRMEAYQALVANAPATLETYNKDLADYNEKYSDWQKQVEQNKVDKAKLADIKSGLLENLSQTPADRTAAYDKYAQDYSAAVHADVDPRFQKIARTEDENANATGMMGSRAYVDTKAELDKLKTQQDTDIATQSTMAKEQLASNDNTYWANLLNQIDSGARADTITRSQALQTASNANAQNYAGTLGYYNAKNSTALADWENKQKLSASYTNAGTGLAGGLLYLYGNRSGGGSVTPSKTELTDPSSVNAFTGKTTGINYGGTKVGLLY